MRRLFSHLLALTPKNSEPCISPVSRHFPSTSRILLRSSRSNHASATSSSSISLPPFEVPADGLSEEAIIALQQLQNVTILEQTAQYVVVSKPPGVVCHHSDWTGSKSRHEIPMVQRTRNAMGGKRVNLIHRLDRGCSGCLLFGMAECVPENQEEGFTNVTAQLAQSLQDANSIKTYLALVRGEGILHGRDLRNEGWFHIDRPIHDERGILQTASTWFRFVAGQHNGIGTIDRPRASLVLARPTTGRWHQIRRHLNGLSHPILGDSTHGSSKENKMWKSRYGMLSERTCLHLARMQLVPTLSCPDGIDVRAPLAEDMLHMLQQHLPSVLENAMPILEEEGIIL